MNSPRSDTSPNFLRPSQLTSLLQLARVRNPYDELCIRLQSQAGLRACEVEFVAASTYSWRNTALHSLNRYASAHSLRKVPLQGTLLQLMESKDLIVCGPLRGLGNQWPHTLNQLAKEAGIPASVDNLRASYALYRLAQRMHPNQVADELGIPRPDWRQNPVISVRAKIDATEWFSA